MDIIGIMSIIGIISFIFQISFYGCYSYIDIISRIGDGQIIETGAQMILALAQAGTFAVSDNSTRL